MGELLLYYKRPDPTTWVYLSSFLTLGLFFVFHRVWSARNLDLLLLILLGPGVLMIHQGYRQAMEETEALVREEQPASLSLASKVEASGIELTVDTKRDAGNDSAESASASPPSTDGDPNTDSLTSDATDPKPIDSLSGDPNDSPDDTDIEDAVREIETETANVQRTGFLYLFAIELLILIRLIIDPLMVRRPKLDPNLTTGGLTFIGISLFIFMMANVVTSNAKTQISQGPTLGPGYSLMNMLPAIPTRPIEVLALSDLRGPAASRVATDPDSEPTPVDSTVAEPMLAEPTPVETVDEPPNEAGIQDEASEESPDEKNRLASVAKILAILAHLAIVSGIVLIANKHFGNLKAGMGCATLYLLLPYTAQMTGRVDHALPSALLLWAVLCYRRPMISGLFLGLAAGLVYYPLFLLPLWISFYWRRGMRQFVVGVVSILAILMLLLSLDSSNSLLGHLQQMFGILNPMKSISDLRGFWALGLHPIWRLPVIVAFVILSVFFAIWPAQKNLGTLISASAAVMVAAQFWHGYGGGLYIAWFLPLLLLAVFRPNLQDRVASKVVRAPTPRPIVAA